MKIINCIIVQLAFLSIIFTVAPRPAFAAVGDTSSPTVTFPPTASNTYFQGQVVAEIINHGTFNQQYRSGFADKMILSDNIVEAGHINNLYVLALDASLYDAPTKAGLFPFDYQAGLRLNLHPILFKYVTLTPGWAAILGNIEVYPRVGYDFGQDKSHAWFATFNLGLGFGPGAGVVAAQ